MKPSRIGWYRWRFNHVGSPGDWSYTYGTREDAKDALYDYTNRFVPDSAQWRGGTVEVVKMPPEQWIVQEINNAKARIKNNAKRITFLRNELLKSNASTSTRKGN